MKIDAINHGIVIDHITAGKGMKIYRLLNLEELSCPVALITNAASKKMGRKDIIKIDGIDSINTDLLGYIDPNATVDIIENGKVAEKVKMKLPLKLVNVLRCKNPRCITSTEQELPQIFDLKDEKEKVYRCRYCEVKAKEQDL